MSLQKLPQSAAAMIGLFGGTFDPFHLGHLQLAASIYTDFRLKEIRLIPCAQSLLRNAPLASAQQRLDMLKLIAEDYDWLKVDDREIKQGGFSATLETVSALRQELPDIPLCFLMSMDQFLQFDKWHCWESIPEFVHLIVTNRPGYTFKPNIKIQNLLKQRQTDNMQLLQQNFCGFIFLHTISALAISSTDIRSRLKTAVEVQNLLPEKIYRYIIQKKLYL